MRKFSDIPQFILKEYIDDIGGFSTTTTDVSGSYEVIEWTEVLFTDTSTVKFIDVNSVSFNVSIELIPRYSFSLSRLNGLGGHNITTYGGSKIVAYAKTETQYEEISLTPMVNYHDASTKDQWEGEYFNFFMGIHKNLVPSNVVNFTVIENGASFTYYDCFSDATYKRVDQRSGYEILLRKDGLFHDWIENNYLMLDGLTKDYYTNYMNTNKDYLFLGHLFPYKSEDDSCRIFRFTMKDYVDNVLPLHNRTENLTTFIDTVFDTHYSKIETKQKELKTLYDAEEMDIKYIKDLGKLYDVNLSLYNVDKENRLRELAGNLPIILKKKGTYSAFIGIWKFAAGFN
jgi:hypothetical protein